MGLFTLGDAGPGVGTEINTQIMMAPVIIVTGHCGLSRHNGGVGMMLDAETNRTFVNLIIEMGLCLYFCIDSATI